MTRFSKAQSVFDCKVTRRNTRSVIGTRANCSGYRPHSKTIHIACGIILILFLSFSVQAEEKQNHPLEIVPEKIVDSLPWSFNLTKEDLTEKGFPYLDTANPPDSLTGYRFVSRNPIQQGNSGGTYLRISVYTGRFIDSKEARDQFHHIKNRADPNIGLSYQWDFVSQSGPFIYHIHAECLLVEEHFLNLTQALTAIIAPDESSRLDQMHCRCGGGCQYE